MKACHAPCRTPPRPVPVRQDFSRIQFAPVGRCIYCDSTEELCREHILPAGLSGTAVLPKASCRSCGKITGEVERIVLRGHLWPVRIVRRLRLGEPHKAPKKFPITVWRAGREETLLLPASEYPVLLHMPILSAPAALTGERFTQGIRMTGVHIISFGPKPNDVGKRLGATRIQHSDTQQPVAFARMIGKIAYSYAVACVGLDAFEEVFVRPMILGTADDAGRWVGTRESVGPKRVGELHHLELHFNQEQRLLVGEVHLLADSDTPSFNVVIGRLRPDYVAPENPPTFR
jgi:hypothetical protein